MKFWEKHSEEMRKARLLQAAAVIRASLTGTHMTLPDRNESSVSAALALEALLEAKLESAKSK